MATNIYQGATLDDARRILERIASEVRTMTGQSVSVQSGDAESLYDRARYDRFAGDLEKAAVDFKEQYLRRVASDIGIEAADSTELSRIDPTYNPIRDYRELGAELAAAAVSSPEPARQIAPTVASSQASSIAPAPTMSGPAGPLDYANHSAIAAGNSTPFFGATPPSMMLPPEGAMMGSAPAPAAGGFDTMTLLLIGAVALAAFYLMKGK